MRQRAREGRFIGPARQQRIKQKTRVTVIKKRSRLRGLERRGLGLLLCRFARRLLALVLFQITLAQPDALRRDFHQFIILNKLDCVFQR